MKIDARTTDLQVVSSYVEDDRELNVQNYASGSVREQFSHQNALRRAV